MIAYGIATELHAVEEASQVGQARRAAQQAAVRLGFDEADAGRAALVATELATNLLRHAGGGMLQLQPVAGHGGNGLELRAVDRGPGFDPAHCLRDGFSTGGTQGIGLGAVMRQTQVFDLHADARGAVVLARLYPRNGTVRDVRFGVCHVPMPGEPVCGDGWALAHQGDRIGVLVLDGLGHGEPAAEAARAGEAAFAEDPLAEPDAAMARLHAAMQRSRGGAGAIARFDGSQGSLAFAGIGNIGASLIGADGSRGLSSHPGILGVRFRKAQTFDFPGARGRLLVMHSDGLQSRWRLGDYPGLAQRHPSVIAAVLQRDFTRGRDDATVLVAALETGND